MLHSLVKSAAIATLVVAALALPAAAAARVVELGATSTRPPASCPDNCQAIGRVTGFQARSGSVLHPFQVRRRGKIVAFSVTLGRPKPDQTTFFNGFFGGPPRARLSILRAGTRNRYRLTGQSEVFGLGRYFGSTPTFALSRPLTVKKGYVVALTVTTWAPAFAVGLGGDEAWRSSRDPARCDDVRQRAAQQGLGSLRTYGCLYRTARLLYTATFIPTPRVTNPGGA